MPSSEVSKSVPARAYLSIGSNLGDRERYLRAALSELKALTGSEVSRVSSIYETDPAYVANQPRFLNLVAEVHVTLSARALFERCKEIEKKLERVTRERWGPREIDLDVLLYNGETIQEEGLVIPHPMMLERSFVLVPLAEIAPDLRLGDGRTASEYAAPWVSEVVKYADF